MTVASTGPGETPQVTASTIRPTAGTTAVQDDRSRASTALSSQCWSFRASPLGLAFTLRAVLLAVLFPRELAAVVDQEAGHTGELVFLHRNNLDQQLFV